MRRTYLSASLSNTVRLALLACCLALALSLCAAAPGRAQDLPIYTDSLQNGFVNWSWATVNLTNTDPVQSGSDSIAVTYGANQGLYLHSGNINTSYYTALSFWVNGGPTGGQQFIIHGTNAGGASLPSVPVTNYLPGGVIPANQWIHVTVPLSDLQVTNLTDFAGFWFQDSTGGNQPVFYVDTISLAAVTAPATVHVAVNAGQSLQTVDSRDFGVNTAIYDPYLGSPSTRTLMTAAGARAFRFPGGSQSDEYDWTMPQSGQSTTPTYGSLVNVLAAQAFIIVNYGSGSPQMAAAWVAYCNASTSSAVTIGLDSAGRNWQTASYWAALRGASPITPDDGLNFLRVDHAAPYGVHHWELGNECYGTWENDTHTPKQDPVLYAGFAQSATMLMKHVDPTIVTGIVITAGEDDWGNQTETVTNPVTGVSHKGWTPNVLAMLNAAGFVPDFVILHNYPSGGDEVLLQSWSWTDIASSVRTMLTDYMGASATTNVQLLATENNTGTSGKQGVSLIDGLYYAESFGGLLQTEFRSLIWWDLRDYLFTTGDDTAAYYGWRLYDDDGMLASGGTLPGSALDTPYPAYFALKLVSKFASGGDTVVAGTSDYPFLTAFAAKRTTGGLSLLVVNTSPSAALTTQFALSGYIPAGTATTYQYGEAQDNLQSTGATVDLAQSTLTDVGPTFTVTFAPYSMTVINLVPASPAVTGFSPSGGPAGTAVTITGTDLGGTSVVGFQGQHAKSFTINATGTQITTIVPAGAVTGLIALQEPNGIIRTATSFAVVAPPSITGFSPASGPAVAAVTITGTNLGGTTIVGFQGQHAKSFTVNAAGTQITTVVPAGAGTGPVALQEPSGILRTATSFTVTH